MSEVVMLAPPEDVRIEDVGRVAAGAAVVVGDGVIARMAASLDALAGTVAAGRVVYGLTTGCGPLCDRPIGDAARRIWHPGRGASGRRCGTSPTRSTAIGHSARTSRPSPKPSAGATSHPGTGMGYKLGA